VPRILYDCQLIPVEPVAISGKKMYHQRSRANPKEQLKIRRGAFGRRPQGARSLVSG